MYECGDERPRVAISGDTLFIPFVKANDQPVRKSLGCSSRIPCSNRIKAGPVTSWIIIFIMGLYTIFIVVNDG